MWVTRVRGVIHKSLRLGIIAAQHALAPRHPQHSGAILIEGQRSIPVYGRSLWIRTIKRELFSCWIQTGDAVNMPHPYLAASISEDPENVIGRQAFGIISVVPVVFELPSALIEPVKTATPASQPEIAACIFENAVDVTAVVPVVRASKVMRHLSCLAVQSIQRARGEPYPENALGILVNRSDPAPRETIRIAGPMRITAELLLAEVENVKPPFSVPTHNTPPLSL